ncbi:hypothetical protein LXA43DRAFT_1060940 [Ganoderma leucocontextum]|nr:hypothetical protein LXA43DRAFT_1060940 [Ganoderma leucocontextum]
MAPFVSSCPLPVVYPQVPPLDNTLGAILIGTFIGLTLYGLVVHQCYQYFGLYPQDSGWIKALVVSILGFETFHMVLSMHVCYHYLVASYSDPRALLSGVWSVSVTPESDVWFHHNNVPKVRVAVQLLRSCEIVKPIAEVLLHPSFFARRIFLLGGIRYRVLVGFSRGFDETDQDIPQFILFAAELGFLCAASIEAYVRESLYASSSLLTFRKNTWLISAGAGTAFVADCLLTGVLVNLLRAQRTGVKRMDRIFDTLILYGVNTGFLTGIVNLLSLLFSLLYPNNLIYAGFGIVATKLYANSLLAALNTRSSLRHTASSAPTTVAGSSTLLTSRLGRETTTRFEMQEQVATSPQKVEIAVENSQAFLTFELVGIAV